MGHLNIRSLPNKIDEVRIIMNEQNFDILAISETWLSAAKLCTFLDTIYIGMIAVAMVEGYYFILKTQYSILTVQIYTSHLILKLYGLKSIMDLHIHFILLVYIIKLQIMKNNIRPC